MSNVHKGKSVCLLKYGKQIIGFKVKTCLTPNGFRKGKLSIKKIDVPEALKLNNLFRFKLLKVPKVIKRVLSLSSVFFFFTFFFLQPCDKLHSCQVIDLIKMITHFNRVAVPPFRLFYFQNELHIVVHQRQITLVFPVFQISVYLFLANLEKGDYFETEMLKSASVYSNKITLGIHLILLLSA